MQQSEWERKEKGNMITDFSDIFIAEDEKEYDKHLYRYSVKDRL